MEISKKKTITVFNTDGLVPGGHYHFTVTEKVRPNPNSISCPIPNPIAFDAIIISVDEERLDVIVYIDPEMDMHLDKELARMFYVHDTDIQNVKYYTIYTTMLEGTCKDEVGLIDIRIKLMM